MTTTSVIDHLRKMGLTEDIPNKKWIGLNGKLEIIIYCQNSHGNYKCNGMSIGRMYNSRRYMNEIPKEQIYRTHYGYKSGLKAIREIIMNYIDP